MRTLRPFFPSILAACLVLLGAAVSMPAFGFWPLGDDGMNYAIVFEGADEEMGEWFGALALDRKTTANPPQNMEELEAEASVLADKVKKALAAKGYMEAVAEPQLDKNAVPPSVHISIEQGARYRLSSIEILWPAQPLAPIDVAVLSSSKGAPLDMGMIEKDALTIHALIAKDACLLSLSVTPKLRLYGASHSAGLVFEVEHGAAANFGAPVITGNHSVTDAVIMRAIAWNQGQCYEEPKVEATRTRLIESQLFASVEVAPETGALAEGEVPMRIAVRERVARTVAAGIEYSTDQGIGIYGSWEHRNLLGGAEKFNSSLALAERKQSLGGTLRIPAFLHDDQVLVLSSSMKREELDAYEALTFENSAGIERRLAAHLKGGLGVGYTLSQTEDNLTGKNQYALLSFPGFVEYDTRSDVLDPRHGLLARIAATPYTETVGDGGQFLKLLATGQHYLSSDTMMLKPTFASRLSVGAIYGGDGDDVPADIRYYAGGGGSVRGYSYQSLSPYFNGDPIGGSSLLEMSGELRLRFTEEFGGVFFVDAGNAYDSATPDFSESLYTGAGTGVRYYSPVGPLRFDIAFPLNGDDIGEDTYQFYVSLGQAF